jgi:nucleoid-associated protein YgaU
VIALIASSGCCRKPPEEVDQAKAAVAQAKENCAEEYANEEYMKAYNALSMAEKYGEDRKCRDAKRAAEEAIALAAEAEVRANEVKADLDAKAKKKMADLDAMVEEGQAAFDAIAAKKAEIDQKREKAMTIAEEKEFAKYGITMELPEAKLDESIEKDAMAWMDKYEAAKAMYAEGGCNLIEVNAALDELPGLSEPIKAKMAANMKALDEVAVQIDQIMEAKLAELVEAMKPKYMTEYTVEKGDCLWKIAEKELVYNNPFQWPLIWWENQWTEEKAMNMTKEERFNLIKDPDLIFPNQHFSLKQEMGQDEIDKAIKYARNRYGKTDWRDIPDFLTDGK